MANPPSRLGVAAPNDPPAGVGQTNLNLLHALLSGGSFVLHGGGQRQDNQVLELSARLHQNAGLPPQLAYEIAHQLVWNPYRGPEGATADPMRQAVVRNLTGH